MLKYIVLWETTSEIAYKYYPEGGEDYGVVVFNKNDKTFKCERLAKDDETKTYAGMLFGKIRAFSQEGVYQREGLIAWY